MNGFTRNRVLPAILAAGLLAVVGCSDGNVGAPAFTSSTPTLMLSADPTAITADGSSTSRIKARVVNGSQTVSFTTTLGRARTRPRRLSMEKRKWFLRRTRLREGDREGDVGIGFGQRGREV